MINDTIINFVSDVYSSYNDDYDINNYKDDMYFMNIHSENLYEYFEYIKYYIITVFVNNKEFDKQNIYGFEVTKDIIKFFIPTISILRDTVLYNFDEDVVQSVWSKIKIKFN